MSADTADDRLLAHVHPPQWVNPHPRGRYHLLVIGGGTAGLVSAMGAAGLGARVALVERGRLGGDCLNTGCVPSKAMLRSARAAADARRGRDLGVAVDRVDPDFAAVMRRMRERRADLAPHDSADRLRAAGVDVYFGSARFTGPESVRVDGHTLTFRRAVIATGGRPAVPPIPGLPGVPFLTSETLFDLDARPARLAIVGAGAIGCEMAQAFTRLGTAVTLIDQAPRILAQDDADAAAVVERRLTAEGVVVRLDTKVAQASQSESGITLRLDHAAAGSGDVTADALLIAVGRAANVDDLDLASAGVAFDSRRVAVDDRLRTSNRRIFAAGDVCSPLKFTHAADAMARVVIQNALFFGRARTSALVIPWCTYTDPEVAHVGLTAEAARGRGRQVDTITVPMADVDRAVVDGERDGFVRIHHERGRLLGCTVVSSRAGEIIALPAYALMRRASVGDLGAIIQPYPTLTAAFRAAGDSYRRTKLTPRVRAILQKYFQIV
jgi:pyruvate/2-oxoglutarate dehydrogenase complex dihydrolipoamide dehydrogenase (E3) component